MTAIITILFELLFVTILTWALAYYAFTKLRRRKLNRAGQVAGFTISWITSAFVDVGLQLSGITTKTAPLESLVPLAVSLMVVAGP